MQKYQYQSIVWFGVIESKVMMTIFSMNRYYQLPSIMLTIFVLMAIVQNIMLAESANNSEHKHEESVTTGMF